MAKITTLRDRETREVLYPQTQARFVHMSNGENLEEAIDTGKFALFDDEWTAAGGTVIASGITYGLNGVNNLTYKEAVEIKLLNGNWQRCQLSLVSTFSQIPHRTLFPIKCPRAATIDYLAYQSANLEVIAFDTITQVVAGNCYYPFMGCKKLREIIGTISLAFDVRLYGIFTECESLEIVQIAHIHTDISFADSPLLSLESIAYLIKFRQNTNAITITVHPEVYSKLTDETNTEWHALLALAAEKNITFATT